MTPKKTIPVYKPLQASSKPIKRKATTLSSSKPKPRRKAKIASQSSSYRKTLIRKADQVFSTYIRRKDAFNDAARCVTCGYTDNYRHMQNGHYISRRRMNLRYDEKNCHVQCPKCNMELGGNLAKYKAYVVSKYGNNVLFYYQQALNSGKKITNADLQAIIDEYTEKLKKIS